MRYGEQGVDSDIFLGSGHPAPELGISGPQHDLDIINGRGDWVLKSGGGANAATPGIKLARCELSPHSHSAETDRGLSQTVIKSPTCSVISLNYLLRFKC